MKRPKLRWGSITEHKLRDGTVKFRARGGDDERGGLGLWDTYEDAEIALDEARKASEAIERAKGPGATFAAYAKAWFEREETAGIRRGVGRELVRFRAHLETAPFAKWPVAAIEQRDLQVWVRDELVLRKARGPGADGERRLSRQTVNRVVALLRSILRSAVEETIIDVNPAAGITVPKYGVTQKVEDPLDASEIDAVLALDISLRRRSIFAIAIFTAMRAGEIYGLRVEDLHLKAKHPHIDVSRSRLGPTKSTQRRRVLLLPPAITWLERWLKERGTAPGLVWPSESGSCHADGYDAGWADTLGRMLDDGTRKVHLGARSLAGIERRVRFHDLRHTCASHLISGSTVWKRRGWIKRAFTMKEVSTWLGHSNITITDKIYAHLLPDGVASAVGKRKRR